MPRNKTDTVEYFPHIAKSGKTLSILEGKHGNDGYAFWFKLLEILSLADGHFYDCSDEIDWQYLISRSHLSDVSATEIINLLCNLRQIDADLWKNRKIIWCQGLVDNFQEVYRKRKRDLPIKPILDNCDRNKDNCDRNTHNSTVPATEGTQSKVKESKEKKIKAMSDPDGSNGSYSPDFLIIYSAYPKNQRGSKKNAYMQFRKLKAQIPPNTPEIIFRQVQEKEKADGLGIFYPEFKHLERWLKAQSWENEPFDFPGVNENGGGPKVSRNPDCPRCHGKGLYQSGTMPDGAPAFLNCQCEKENVSQAATN
jgi:hypothetical protein